MHRICRCDNGTTKWNCVVAYHYELLAQGLRHATMRGNFSQCQRINFICVYENLFSSSFLLACDGVCPSRGGTAFHNFGILEHFCGAFLLSVQQVAHTCQKRHDRFHSGSSYGKARNP